MAVRTVVLMVVTVGLFVCLSICGVHVISCGCFHFILDSHTHKASLSHCRHPHLKNEILKPCK